MLKKLFLMLTVFLLTTFSSYSQSKGGGFWGALKSTIQQAAQQPTQSSRGQGYNRYNSTSPSKTTQPQETESQRQERLKKEARQQKIQFNETLTPVIHDEWGIFKMGTKEYSHLEENELKKILIPEDLEQFSDSLFDAALESNDPILLKKLADAYWWGAGTSTDKNTAFKLYKQAAEQGNWEGLMRSFYDENYRYRSRGDLESLKQKALNDGYAPFIMYFDVKKAAELGYPEAIYEMSVLDNNHTEFDYHLLAKIEHYPQAAFRLAQLLFGQSQNEVAYNCLKPFVYDPNYLSYLRKHLEGYWTIDFLQELKDYGLANDPEKIKDLESQLYEELTSSLGYDRRPSYKCTRLLNTENGKKIDNFEFYYNAINWFSGDGIERHKAVRYIEEKINQGDAFAIFVEACAISAANERAERMKTAADKGFAPAQYFYGYYLWHISQYSNANKWAAAEHYYSLAFSNNYCISNEAKKEYRGILNHIKEQEKYKANQAEYAAYKEKFINKYGSNVFNSLENGRVQVGMPLSALSDYKNQSFFSKFKYELSIDHGSSKCYDIYRLDIIWTRIGFAWVTNGKITSFYIY